jgi:hypothetical protein
MTFETMTDETQGPPPRLGECLETLLEHLGPAEQRALAATSRGYRATVARVHEVCPDTFEALVGAPGAWVPASFAELGAIDTQRGGLRPQLLLSLARVVDAAGRVRVPTSGWRGFRRISFAHAGAARDRGDDFLQECAADEVDYAGCTGVSRVGDGWMRGSRIDSVRYAGLDALAAVGDGWVTYCAALAAPCFAGLAALAAVGDDWMSSCASLTAPDFTGLGALARVGNHWMLDCASLAAPDFTGLGVLAAVGDLWMWDCASLAAPNFTGLGALARVGDGWMSKCSALVAIDSDPAGHAARRAAALRLARS